MKEYKIKLTMVEEYELFVNANSRDEAYRIANDMDIDEFDETGKITIDMEVISGV